MTSFSFHGYELQQFYFDRIQPESDCIGEAVTEQKDPSWENPQQDLEMDPR